MVFAIWVPESPSDDASYASLRKSGSQTATVFKTFDACYATMYTTYLKTMNDVGADEHGFFLSDKSKSLGILATCVRVY